MKTLYVSDMDGTLLNSNKVVSEYSHQIINRFVEKGGLFTIATARFAYGADDKVKALDLRVPAILMNGVALYTFNNKKYVKVESIARERVAEVENVLEKHHKYGFMYIYENNKISMFYRDAADLQYDQYYSKRAREECAEIIQTQSFTREAQNRDVIYFALTGQEEELNAIWRDMQGIEGMGTAYYLNVYNGLYCLEVFAGHANKATALAELKDMLEADEVIVFGDNHNDISMMEVADGSYAPENAVDEVKELANGIIPSCDDDGVARYLQEKYSL